MHGAVVSLRGVNVTCFVVCEVQDNTVRKRRHLAFRDADGFGPPCNDVLAAMEEHPNFERIENTVDQYRNLCFRFRG